MISLAVIVVLSYMVGSIPGSVWVGKAVTGIDVRNHGSGNAGATNAFRVLGWKVGTLATVVDVGKGLFAAGVIALIRIDPVPEFTTLWQIDTFVKLVAGAAAVGGHIAPVWAGFRGGKGVNTAAGVLFAITWESMTIALIVFVIVLLSTRYVSLASMIATISLPVTVAIRKYIVGVEEMDGSILVLSIIIASILVLAHTPNIKRLLAGTERRVRTFRPAKGMVGRGEI